MIGPEEFATEASIESDNIDVAILSNPTDQNKLQRVKQDLSSMNKTYTS